VDHLVSAVDIASQSEVVQLINAALAEDVGSGDVTTLALVPPDRMTTAILLSREAAVVSGGRIAKAVFEAVDSALVVETVVADGDLVAEGATILRIEGSAASILVAERTALNFMQRLSGIATLTRAFVDRTSEHGTAILDTRKTTPGYRLLEKYAVQCGGGTNHRMGLFDRVLIKDNHRRLWGEQNRGGLDAAVDEARAKFPDIAVEIEVESVSELADVLRSNPDWVLLDNMSPEIMAECVALCAGRCKTEASGGITLETVAAAAASGVDAISLGCLTHSARSVDLSLELA
jgi:nicotinate-nucleotide pyrophosphorylase (carboxylating)